MANREAEDDLVITKDGFVKCLKCELQILVGNGGLNNFKKQHLRSKQCENERKKKEKERAAQHNTRPLTAFFRKKSSALPIPSTMSAPHPIISSTQSGDRAPALPASKSMPSKACPKARQLLHKLREAMAHVPASSLPEADNDDIITQFSGKPPSVPSESAWEVLNPMLNRLVGYETTAQQAALRLHHGERGLDGLYRYLNHFVEINGIPGALFEGKMSVLLEAIKIISAQGHDNHNVDGTATTILDSDDDDGIMLLDHNPSKPANQEDGSIVQRCTTDSDCEDDIVIVHHRKTQRCSGYVLTFPQGQNASSSYPFMLHDMRGLPWNYELRNNIFTLRACSCSGKAVVNNRCTECESLHEHAHLVSIINQIENRVHENAPFMYYGCGALMKLVRHKNTTIDELRLQHLNDACKLVVHAGIIDQHKQMLLVLASTKISRIDHILQAEFNKKLGLHEILDLVKLGGDRVANIANHIFGSPAATTVRHRPMISLLLTSPVYPQQEEVAKNVEACFEVLKNLELLGLAQNLFHGIVIFDEIAAESRLRWDDKSNKFLGLCREHAHKTTIEFETNDDLEMVFEDLDCGEVHLTSEATVGALGMLTFEARLYSAHPVLISDSCKCENADQHAALIQTTVDALDSRVDLTRTRIVSLASDGEARQGRALINLTFKHLLQPSSPIFSMLSPLALMDLHVGDDDLTPDKDYKHVFKCLQNALLHKKGPGFLAARHALKVFGVFCYNLVYPYICIDMSLKEQLEHLSTAAHLALVLYKYENAWTDFLPSMLYIDLMLMVKNAYFCIAKAKVDLLNSKFYLILLGTDRLKTLFGILCTMVGNDSNLDILQLALRLTGTTDIANILARDSNSIPDAADHINPRSWHGDVYVQTVSLASCWKQGHCVIKDLYDFSADFLSKVDSASHSSILASDGTLLFSMPISEEDDEALGSDTSADVQPSVDNTTDTSGDGLRELEDLAIEAEFNLSEHQPFLKAINIDGKGTMVNKARALALRFKYKKMVSSTDHLRRVQQEGCYNSTVQFLQVDGLGFTDTGPSLLIHDPIATLVSCDCQLFLCIGEINGIWMDSKLIDELSVELLAEKTVTISYQALRLIPTTTEDDPELKYNWRSSHSLSLSFKVPGTLVQLINPPLLTRIPMRPHLLFDSSTLMALASSIHDQMTCNHMQLILHMKNTSEFPYRESSGSFQSYLLW
ncbi:hypothetical protein EWM64_g6442 [Hericium alpestre]|uniref:Uncharacterized protein n=1 Tax=Hericium alpestre TaxID=135208 RepID=A0A4Y9ZS11_9AGAM|nr:hypothetical protein EWM64_g6442 [Hericium alpestre]